MRIVLVVLFKVCEALGEVDHLENVLQFARPLGSFEGWAHLGLQSKMRREFTKKIPKKAANADFSESRVYEV